MNLTKKQAALKELIKQKLIIEQDSDDPHCAHTNADKYLCELLEGLGFKDIVHEWKSIKKWYS